MTKVSINEDGKKSPFGEGQRVTICLGINARGGDAGVMMLGQEIGEFLVRRLGEASFLPQIRGQVGVGLGDGSICGLGEVTQSGGGTASLRVAILDTSHVQQLLGDTSGDDSSTARSWDQTHNGAATFACNFARNGMGFSDLVTPVSTTHRDDGQLGEDDSSSNGSSHLFGAFDAEANVTIAVTDSDESLEPRTLTGARLLLDGHDLQNLILQAGAKEVIDDLAFFDGQREEVDLFQGLDLAIFNETTQLGDRNPLFLLFLATTTASTPAAATTTASSAPSSVSETASKTSTVSTGWCCVRHWWILSFFQIL